MLHIQGRFDGTYNLSSSAGGTNTVRIVAAPTRVYALVRLNSATHGTVLYEINPDCSGGRQIGSLFIGEANTTLAITGACWDEQNGVIKVLTLHNAVQTVYTVSVETGQASAPQILPNSAPILSGLAQYGAHLLSANGTAVMQINQVTRAVTSLSKTLPINGNVLGGFDRISANNFLVSSHAGLLYNYNIVTNTSAIIQRPRFTQGTSQGASMFGNNIYICNVHQTGTTYAVSFRFMRERQAVDVGTSVLFSGGGDASIGGYIPALVQKPNNVVYAAYNLKLYQINTWDGTATEIGTTGQHFRVLVWEPTGRRLYGFTNSQLYRINTTTGEATNAVALSAIPSAALRYGYARDAQSAVMIDNQGQARIINFASGRVFPPFNVTVPTGITSGYRKNDAHWVYDGTIDRNLTHLVSPFRAAVIHDGGIFDINGVMYQVVQTQAGTQDSWKLQRYTGILPSLYSAGTPVVSLQLDAPATISGPRSGAYSAILPPAHGGTGPYTYELRYNGSTTLPTGVTFDTNTRLLSVAASVSTRAYYLFEYRATDSETPTRQVARTVRVRGFFSIVTGGFRFVSTITDQTYQFGTSHSIGLPEIVGFVGANDSTYSLSVSVNGGPSTTTMPEGVTYDASHGALNFNTNTPAGVYAFAYTGIEPRRFGTEHTTQRFTVTVLAPSLTLPSINNVSLDADEDYSQTLPAASRAATYQLQKFVPAGQTPNTVNITMEQTGTLSSVGGVGWLRFASGLGLFGSIDNTVDDGIQGIGYDDASDLLYVLTNPDDTLTGVTVDGTRLTEDVAAFPLTLSGVNVNATGFVFSPGGLTSIPNVRFHLSTGDTPVSQPTPARTENLPRGFTFNPTSRHFAVDGSIDAPGAHTLRYTATADTQTATQDFNVAVTRQRLLRITGADISGHMGAAHTHVLSAATGGNENYTYTLTGAPTGVSFNAVTRTITVGANVAAGTYELTYGVRDGQAHTASATVTLTQLPAVTALTLPAPADVTFDKNTQNRSASLPEAAGGTTPYTYTLTQADDSALPAGMSFTPSTRAFSILTSTAVGRYTLKYKVTDSAGTPQEAEQQFTVNVRLRPPAPLFLPTGFTRTMKRSTSRTPIALPAASGGVPAYSYGVDSTFPAEAYISISGTTLLVNAGIPLGTYGITYFVVDDADNEVRSTFTLRVVDTLSLPTPRQISVRKDTGPHSYQLPAGRGDGTLVYSISGNPTGVVFLAATRALTVNSGVAAEGTSTLTYSVTDGSETINRQFRVRIDPPLIPYEPEPPVIVDPPPPPPPEPAPKPTTVALENPNQNPCANGETPVRLSGADVGVKADNTLDLTNAACGLSTVQFRCGDDVAGIPSSPAANSQITQIYTNRVRVDSGPLVQRSNGVASGYLILASRVIRTTNPACPNQAGFAIQHGAYTYAVDARATAAADFAANERDRTDIPTGSAFFPSGPVQSYPALGLHRVARLGISHNLCLGEQSTTHCRIYATPSGLNVNHGNALWVCTAGQTGTPGTPGRRAPRVTALLLKRCKPLPPAQITINLDWGQIRRNYVSNNRILHEFAAPNSPDGSAVTINARGLPAGIRYESKTTCLTFDDIRLVEEIVGQRRTFELDYTNDAGTTTTTMTLATVQGTYSGPSIRELAPPGPPQPLVVPEVRPSHDLDILGRGLTGVIGCGEFSIPLPTAIGGSGDYTYTVYDLPDGVRFDPEEHALVGYSEVPIEAEITLRVYDGTGAVSDEVMQLRLVERASAENPLYTIESYNQTTIKDIVQRKLPLTFDISHMRVYKSEMTLTVYFESQAGRQNILVAADTRQGKFSVQKEGGKTFLHIAPEVVRSMYGQMQAQETGCWYLEVRSSLMPLVHRTEFGNTDIAESALEEEFKRLDIQDQTKIVDLTAVPPEPAPSTVGPSQIKKEAVLTNHLVTGAVEARSTRSSSVTSPKLKDGSVTRPKIATHAVRDNKIEQNKVDTIHVKAGAVGASKFADPSTKLASPVHQTATIEDGAVTTPKIKDAAVSKRALAADAVKTDNIKDGAVTPDKVAGLTAGNMKDFGFRRAIGDREVGTENIQDGAVGRRQLDYRNLAKYLRNEMAIFDLPVLNPDQIAPGTPCGFHVLPGDTKPTAFKLEGSYEYVPEEVEQDPRDINVYGGLPRGGEVPDVDTKTINVKSLYFGTTKITDAPKGVHCLNVTRVGSVSLVAYLVQGAYLHGSNKVYRAGTSSVPAASAGASNDLTNMNKRLNLVIERRTDVTDADSTTHFYMNTVMWNDDLDMDTDKLTQYSTIELERIEGRESQGGIYAGVHVSIAGTTEQEFAKKLGTNWRCPLSSGSPNNLPPIRTQLYAFSLAASSFTNAAPGLTAWKQTLIDAPKLRNVDGAYESAADRKLSSSTTPTAKTRREASLESLPGFGLSLVAESAADKTARRQQTKFASSPDTELVHLCIPAQGLQQLRKYTTTVLGIETGSGNNHYSYIPVMKYAFGVKGATVNNKWAVSAWSHYTDSASTAAERTLPDNLGTLPTDLDARATANMGAFEVFEDTDNPPRVGRMSDGFLVGVAPENILINRLTATPLYERDIPLMRWFARQQTSMPGLLAENDQYVFIPTADNLAPRNIGGSLLVWGAAIKTAASNITRTLRKRAATFEESQDPTIYTDVFPITAVPNTQVHVQSVFSTSGIYRYSYTSDVNGEVVTVKRGLRRYAPDATQEDS